ncbi:MAG TPA: dicarboxylate/amino acid:cation symporter [Candidatus Acidoferrales bacterium]|jgi:aerobic C4-dicarboxylate transport protein|nr:dicarboxylate/amino acid:cation symporter [Candidatus Acidoferrales bacterium]
MQTPHKATPKKFYRTLYFRVLVGILLGIVLGVVAPSTAGKMEPFGVGFIKLIRMMIGPVIFFTVVVGIASIGDMRKLGRVGLKALLYFEVLTTVALLIGLAVVDVVRPGAGMNVDASKLDASAIQSYAAQGHHLSSVDFAMNIIPKTFIGAFSEGEILQVLLLAILVGLALAALGQGKTLIAGCEKVAHLMFGVIGLIMQAAPIGAFGAMAYTVGHYGLKTLIPLAKLMACVYVTSIAFVFVVLGIIASMHGFSIWKFIRYIKEELLIVLGTSSSESVLPRIMVKMEALGCSKSVVGLVIPAGYSFNLDGTSIYLTIAAIFVAQATNTHLTGSQEAFLLLILMLSSKGAAAVTGGGFITLSATLQAVGTVPMAGLTLLLGVDRFMSEMRALTNLVGNGVATIVVAKWERELDEGRMKRVLNGEEEVNDDTLAAAAAIERVPFVDHPELAMAGRR